MTDRGVSDPAPFDPGYGPLVSTHVRIATWNIWARYGPWPERAPVIESTLREIDADIVGLQEVWDDGTRKQIARVTQAFLKMKKFDLAELRKAYQG
jgi:endonuclease/exonuclease/phosphatase family metal-dependent hydrolase